VLYPDADMEQIAAGLGDATAADAARRRGNAVELLENLLDRTLRRRFLPLLEDLPRAQRLRMAEADFPSRPLTPEAALAELARDEAAWVRACAAWCLAESRAPEAGRLLEPALEDRSPVVREIALASLATLAPARALGLAQARLGDDASLVRTLAAALVRRLGPLQPAGLAAS
jgi:hypothetical protein